MSLPRALLALSLLIASSSALSSSVSLPQTSFNDPFRAVVVVHRAVQPEPPLCCLKPLPTVDTLDGPEDVLLSFEEWKSKKVQTELQGLPVKANAELSDNDATSKSTLQHSETPPMDTHTPDLHSEDALPPHFRVPITDRFNYANMDCSSRVHMSHKSAKSPSSILSSKKDKYMLSPCSTEEQFVVVELCDDIRIDTVQLANFEFFSGVFKDFSVSVAKTYTGTNEGWTPAGTYRAKNVRGVQSFHPPTSLRDFYRYIRIDFHSHYGHEYYCPVSLLRVYGLTHLEEWKWDMWEAESRARLKDSPAQHAMNAERPAVSGDPLPKSDMNISATEPQTNRSHSNDTSRSPQTNGSSGNPQSASQSRRRPSSGSRRGEDTLITAAGEVAQQSFSTVATGVTSVTEAISALPSLSSLSSSSSTSSTGETHPHSSDTEAHVITTPLTYASTSSTPPHTQLPSHALPPLQGGGESIYRTIMNRLTLLEANHTLYARYVEEQTAGVRDVLRKLSEEVGRLESITRMQAQMYQRTVHEWERQRLRLELEHGELLSRVNYLSNEVVLEKRLGIAQLCLLLAVLVFIGFTRGAPSAHQPLTTSHRSTREWGVRNLSFGSSADGWNPLRRRSRSPTEQSGNTKAEKATGTDVPLTFPIRDHPPDPKAESSTTAFSLQLPAKPPKPTVVTSSHSHLHSQSHLHSHSHKRSTAPSFFRTPTKPRSASLLIDPHTLPRAEPIARSHSSSTSGHHNVRSAKRWARTAHLHEIKISRERRGSASASASASNKRVEKHRERENDDVFSVPSSKSKSSGTINTPPDTSVSDLPTTTRRWSLRRPLTPLGSPVRIRSQMVDSTDGDVWVDTDVEGEDEAEAEERSGSEVEGEICEGRVEGRCGLEGRGVVVLNSPDVDVFGGS